jgi:hypothetical protein
VTLLTHVAFAHKEYRFVYPVVALLVVLASLGLAEVAARVSRRLAVPAAWVAAAALLLWLATSAWAAARFRSDGSFGHTRPGASLWAQGRPGLEATGALGADPRVCGIAFVNVNWTWTGAYTWLHRDVPLTVSESAQDFFARAAGYNAAVVEKALVRDLVGFAADRCWEDVCIVRRPGACEPLPGKALNAQLASWGW